MMETLLLRVASDDLTSPASQASLDAAAKLLRAGGTVAFPTETVYGLGANALDSSGVSRIFEAKQRPSWDPLIVHLADFDVLEQIVAEVSPNDRLLMKAFWPGALTLLMPRRELIPSSVTAGRPLVGVRMPAHPVARALLRLAAVPVAAPSANSFSKTSPTTAQHVMEDLAGRIDAVVDGGATHLGLESTVLDANAVPPVIYRPGMISIDQLRCLLPDITAYVPGEVGTAPSALPAPGVGLRHYAPRAELVPVSLEGLAMALESAARRSGSTGVLLPEGVGAIPPEGMEVFPWGRWADMESLARELFSGLRELDRRGVARIVCPLPAAEGLGVALRDRLEKAAKPHP